MSNQLPIIIAVDPGTRELGVAVFSGGKELVFYNVKTVTNRKSPLAALEIIAAYIRNLIKKYRPQVLAIEKMFITQRNSALLAVAAEQIKAVAKEANLPIYEYAPTTIRKRLCQSGRATKREVARILAGKYPELNRYYLRTAQWEKNYYANLFDAVAIAVVCAEDLKDASVKEGQV